MFEVEAERTGQGRGMLEVEADRTGTGAGGALAEFSSEKFCAIGNNGYICTPETMFFGEVSAQVVKLVDTLL